MNNKPIGSYQTGRVQVCENCNHDNFYLDFSVGNDLYGPMPTSFILDQKLNPNTFQLNMVWCRACAHCQELSNSVKAIRFACPDCDRINIHAIEPKEIRYYETGDRYIYYGPHEIECLYCNSKFKQMSIINGENTPDWWVTQHLWRYDG